MWSDIVILITPDWEMLSCEFVKIWSIRVEVLQVILVGEFINCLKPYIEQNSLHFIISGEKSLKWFYFYFYLFLSGFSLTNIHDSQDGRGRGKPCPLYHFHPLHRHLDISRAITAESSPLHKASSWTRIGNLWFQSENFMSFIKNAISLK